MALAGLFLSADTDSDCLLFMPDLLATCAPERAALRERHRSCVPGRDSLNPWDMYLYDCERTTEAWAVALSS